MQKQLIKFMNATEEHLELIFKWRNMLSIREVMYNSNLIDWSDHIRWFSSMLTDDLNFFKVLYYENIPYGVANFKYINKDTRTGEWGFYIGRNDAPKGMGKLLAYEMLSFLFEEIKVRKICAEVLDYNEVSIAFHKKVGFNQDGILRKHKLKNDIYCDIHLFSIFENEWAQKKFELEKELFN